VNCIALSLVEGVSRAGYWLMVDGRSLLAALFQSILHNIKLHGIFYLEDFVGRFVFR